MRPEPPSKYPEEKCENNEIAKQLVELRWVNWYAVAGMTNGIDKRAPRGCWLSVAAAIQDTSHSAYRLCQDNSGSGQVGQWGKGDSMQPAVDPHA